MGHFIGQGHRGNPCRLAAHQLSEPLATWGFLGSFASQLRRGPYNQKLSQTGFSFLRYVPQSLLAAARVLAWHKAYPCSKLTPRFKLFAGADCPENGSSSDNTNTGNRCQSLTVSVGFMPGCHLLIELDDLLFKRKRTVMTVRLQLVTHPSRICL